MGNLKAQVARGSMFMGVSTLMTRLFSVLSMVFLARLLDPSDFGRVALALVLFSAARIFSGLGMAQAVVQTRRPNSEVVFWAFMINCAFGTTLFLIVNLNPDIFARFLGDPQLVPIIRALSLLLILGTWGLVPSALLRKDMKFGLLSRATVVSDFVSNLLAVMMALIGLGVWSLVIAHLMGSTLRMLLIFQASWKYRWYVPSPWNGEAIREIVAFGLKSTSSGFMNYVNSNLDDWFVGRVLGVTALGFYDKAYGLTNNILSGINEGVIDSVLFPAYAKIQDNRSRLANAYINGLTLTAALMSPLSMGVFVVATELVSTLLGEKWLPMITTLQIFAFMALVRPLAGSTSPLFRALGRPDYSTRAALVVFVIMVPMALYLIRWGIEGVAFAVTFSYACGFLYNIYQVRLILPDASGKMIPAIRPALFSAVVMVVGVWGARYLLDYFNLFTGDWARLLLLSSVGGFLYLMSIFLLQRSLARELLSIVLSATKLNRLNRVAKQPV